MFPTPYTVQHVRWTSGGTDDHGNPVDVWSVPVDVQVYGWSGPKAEEEIAGTDRVTVDLRLMVPPDVTAGHRDRFVLPSGQFEVVGEVQDYNHGPWQWRPGSVINLRRVEG